MGKLLLSFLTMIIIVLSFALVPTISFNHAYSTASSPSYAKIGSYALYEGNGGYVSFLGGVSSNISYYVTNVFPNDTMVVFVNATISMGSESGVPPSTILRNFSDSVSSPRILPAVPPQNLTNNDIFFQNTTCKFVKNSMLTVPAGNFNATEFQGVDANGTTLTFWFDRTTGLAIQMVQAISYLQLIQSDIGVPLKTQTSLQAELPFLAVFVVGWSLAGVVFYTVWRHYARKNKELDQTKRKKISKSRRKLERQSSPEANKSKDE